MTTFRTATLALLIGSLTATSSLTADDRQRLPIPGKNAAAAKTNTAAINPLEARGLNPQPEPPSKLSVASNPAALRGLNPQPEPPSTTTVVQNPAALRGLNPQPEPPSINSAFKNPLEARGLNPQPEPPSRSLKFTNPAALRGLNPQPEPPSLVHPRLNGQVLPPRRGAGSWSGGDTPRRDQQMEVNRDSGSSKTGWSRDLAYVSGRLEKGRLKFEAMNVGNAQVTSTWIDVVVRKNGKAYARSGMINLGKRFAPGERWDFDLHVVRWLSEARRNAGKHTSWEGFTLEVLVLGAGDKNRENGRGSIALQ